MLRDVLKTMQPFARATDSATKSRVVIFEPWWSGRDRVPVRDVTNNRMGKARVVSTERLTKVKPFPGKEDVAERYFKQD